MFRHTTKKGYTAEINKDGTRATIYFDDGWDEMIDRTIPTKDESEARKILTELGFEEYDPNANLKSKGMVFINGMYRMPEAAH